MRGDAYRADGNTAAALADYNMAVDLEPDYTEAYASRAEVYSEVGDIQRAYDDYSLVISLDEDDVDPDVLYKRGMVRMRLGDSAGARSDLQAAADRYLETGQTDGYRETVIYLRQL
jgi:tetratricopeptide (TPR) repeat protein